MAVLRNIRQLGTITDTIFDFLPGTVFDFTIKTHGSGFLGLPDILILSGTAAPLAPMQFGFNTNLKKTQYPGNDVPSTQVFTTSKAPLRIRGELRDYKLAGFTSMFYMEQLKRMAKSKLAVSIEWGPIAKEGFIQEAQFNIHRNDFIEYDVTFEILSDFGDGPFELDFSRPIRTVLSLMNQLSTEFQSVTQLFNAVPGGFGSKITSKITTPMGRAMSSASRIF